MYCEQFMSSNHTKGKEINKVYKRVKSKAVFCRFHFPSMSVFIFRPPAATRKKQKQKQRTDAGQAGIRRVSETSFMRTCGARSLPHSHFSLGQESLQGRNIVRRG